MHHLLYTNTSAYWELLTFGVVLQW